MLQGICDLCRSPVTLNDAEDSCPKVETSPSMGALENLVRVFIEVAPIDEDKESGRECHLCGACRYLLKVHTRAMLSRIILHRKGLYQMPTPPEGYAGEDED